MSNQKLLKKLIKSGEACACFNLRSASRAVTQLYDDEFRGLGLRSTQLSVLGTLRRLGPLTISELAEALVTDRTTLTRNLQLLEDRGMIRILPGDDRRKREVVLSKAGSRVLEKAAPLWKNVQTRIRQGLGERRFKRFLADLSTVVELARS